MILNKTHLYIPTKIKKLLNKYWLVAIFLSDENYTFVEEVCGCKMNSLAMAFSKLHLIVVNETKIRNLGLSQEELNYILLHEIAHAGEKDHTEEGANKITIGLSKKCSIAIDNTQFDVIVKYTTESAEKLLYNTKKGK